MTDRELLERAAKAAGYKVAWEGGCETGWMAGSSWWNPLTDDGDALRLAVKLGFRIDIDRDRAWAAVIARGIHAILETNDDLDPYAATRRAIVRAAAEMAK